MKFQLFIFAILITLTSYKKKTITQIIQTPNKQGQNQLQIMNKVKLTQNLEFPENTVTSRLWYKSSFCDLIYDLDPEEKQTVADGTELTFIQKELKSNNKFSLTYKAQMKKSNSLRDLEYHLKKKHIKNISFQVLLEEIFMSNVHRPFHIHWNDHVQSFAIDIKAMKVKRLSSDGDLFQTHDRDAPADGTICSIEPDKSVFFGSFPPSGTSLPESTFIVQVTKFKYFISPGVKTLLAAGRVDVTNIKNPKPEDFIMPTNSTFSCEVSRKDYEKYGLEKAIQLAFKTIVLF